MVLSLQTENYAFKQEQYSATFNLKIIWCYAFLNWNNIVLYVMPNWYSNIPLNKNDIALNFQPGMVWYIQTPL